MQTAIESISDIPLVQKVVTEIFETGRKEITRSEDSGEIMGLQAAISSILPPNQRSSFVSFDDLIEPGNKPPSEILESQSGLEQPGVSDSNENIQFEQIPTNLASFSGVQSSDKNLEPFPVQSVQPGVSNENIRFEQINPDSFDPGVEKLAKSLEPFSVENVQAGVSFSTENIQFKQTSNNFDHGYQSLGSEATEKTNSVEESSKFKHYPLLDKALSIISEPEIIDKSKPVMKLSLQQIQDLDFDRINDDVVIEIIDIPEVNDFAASTSSEDKIDTMVASTSSNSEKSITKPTIQNQIILQTKREILHDNSNQNDLKLGDDVNIIDESNRNIDPPKPGRKTKVAIPVVRYMSPNDLGGNEAGFQLSESFAAFAASVQKNALHLDPSFYKKRDAATEAFLKILRSTIIDNESHYQLRYKREGNKKKKEAEE